MSVARRFLFFLLIFLVFPYLNAHEASDISSVVISRIEGKSTTYDFVGKEIRFDKVYPFLRDRLSSLDMTNEFRVLFGENVPFSSVVNMRKTLESLGFLKIRYFVYSMDGREMMEIEMRNSEPFRRLP